MAKVGALWLAMITGHQRNYEQCDWPTQRLLKILLASTKTSYLIGHQKNQRIQGLTRLRKCSKLFFFIYIRYYRVHSTSAVWIYLMSVGAGLHFTIAHVNFAISNKKSHSTSRQSRVYRGRRIAVLCGGSGLFYRCTWYISVWI